MEERVYTPFFTSWQEALSHLSEKARGEATAAILYYGAYGEDPPKLPKGAAMCAYLLCKPSLDASRTKALNGQKGGKQNGSKREANDKQTESETEANAKHKEKEKEEEYKRKNKKRKDDCFLHHGDPPTPLQKEAIDRLLAEEGAENEDNRTAERMA